MSDDRTVEAEIVEVEILGEEYTLKSETSAEYTRKVAEHVDRMAAQVRRESGVMDPKRLAILTALAVTDQLFRLRDGVDRVRELIERRAERLSEEVLAVVGGEAEG